MRREKVEEKDEEVVLQKDLKRQVVALWIIVLGVIVVCAIWCVCSYIALDSKIADLGNDTTKDKQLTEVNNIEVVCSDSEMAITKEVTIGTGATVGSFRLWVATEHDTISYTIYVDDLEIEHRNHQVVFSEAAMIEYFYYPDKQIKVVVE